MDEVRELRGVADEEDRRVIPDQVVVALLGVELQREAARVAHGVGRAQLAGHGGEAREDVGPLALRAQERGARPLGDILGDLEEAVRAVPAGVHHALRDSLAVELRHLLHEIVVLQQKRAVRAGGERMLVARRRDPRVGRGVWRMFAHSFAPWTLVARRPFAALR
jgi:hypothetical protein